MPGASPHPVSPEPIDTPDVADTPTEPVGNDAGYERAELRLTRALERLDAAIDAQAAKALTADEAEVRLKRENTRLEGENTALKGARDQVENRLDTAIGRLSGLLATPADVDG